MLRLGARIGAKWLNVDPVPLFKKRLTMVDLFSKEHPSVSAQGGGKFVVPVEQNIPVEHS